MKDLLTILLKYYYGYIRWSCWNFPRNVSARHFSLALPTVCMRVTRRSRDPYSHTCNDLNEIFAAVRHHRHPFTKERQSQKHASEVLPPDKNFFSTSHTRWVRNRTAAVASALRRRGCARRYPARRRSPTSRRPHSSPLALPNRRSSSVRGRSHLGFRCPWAMGPPLRRHRHPVATLPLKPDLPQPSFEIFPQKVFPGDLFVSRRANARTSLGQSRYMTH